jgi:hypothetical protein
VSLIAVNSSNLAAVGYDPWRGVLIIAFHGGRMYRYGGVPHGIYTALILPNEPISTAQEWTCTAPTPHHFRRTGVEPVVGMDWPQTIGDPDSQTRSRPCAQPQSALRDS